MFQSPAIRTTPRLPPSRFYLLRPSSKVRSSHLSSKFRHSAQACNTANSARPTRIRQLIPHAQAQAQSPRTGQPPNLKPWSGRTPTHQTEKSLWTRWKQNKLKTQLPDGSSTTHAVALQPKAAPLPLSLTPNPTIPGSPPDDVVNLRRLPSTTPPAAGDNDCSPILSLTFPHPHDVQHKRFPATTPRHCWIPDLRFIEFDHKRKTISYKNLEGCPRGSSRKTMKELKYFPTMPCEPGLDLLGCDVLWDRYVVMFIKLCIAS